MFIYILMGLLMDFNNVIFRFPFARKVKSDVGLHEILVQNLYTEMEIFVP